MTATEEYNGWPNRETWAAALHLSNDPALSGIADALAAESVREAQAFQTEHPELAGAVDLERRAATICADKLGELMDEWAADLHELVTGMGEGPGPTVAMMLDEIGSRWRVDWRKIAEGYVLSAMEWEATP